MDSKRPGHGGHSVPESHRPPPRGPRNTPARPKNTPSGSGPNNSARPAPPPPRSVLPGHAGVPEDGQTKIQGAIGSASPSSNGGSGAGSTGGPQGPAAVGKTRPPKGRVRPLTVVSHMLLNLVKAFLVMLCIGLVVGSVIAVQMVQYVVEATENDEDMLDLESRKMNETTYFMALNPDNPNAREENDYIEYQQLVGDENRVWVDDAQIPEDLKNAVIATEDQEFPTHHGVNIQRTVGAFINEIIPIPGMTGGASTITQQLIKNITGEKTVADEESGRAAGWQRKMREIFRAWGLENRYSKSMILESYLNTISLSGRLAGVEAGAQAYFGKTVSELNLAECATIAGITQYPSRYNPFTNPENCLARRNRVVGYMLECGYVTQAQYDEVIAQKTLGLADTDSQQTVSSTATGVFSYAVDKAFDDVLRDLQEVKGYSAAEAEQYLYNGGLRVYMTVDLNIQEALDDIMVDGYKDGSEDGEWGFFLDPERFPGYMDRMAVTEEDGTVVLPQAAAVVINYNGELLATNGAIGEKEGSLSLNRSIGTLNADGTVDGTLRQVGSVMKPIAAYALGIDYGIITYSKTVQDDPVLPRDSNLRNDPNATKDWPQNYSRSYSHRRVSVAGAIAESLNTVAAQVGIWVGADMMYNFLTESLEISSFDPTRDMDFAPMALGAQTYGMSAYELAGAYQMFGGNDSYGVFNTLHSYVRVTDAKGNIVLEPVLNSEQAISPESGFIMNKLLEGPLSTGRVGGMSPTAPGMVPEGEMPAVGKTGTTNDDFDRWFVGLTPYYVTSVWWGYDKAYGEGGHSLSSWSPNGRTNIPVNVWKYLMEQVQAELPVKQFPEMPEGIVEQNACASTGDLPGPGCTTVKSYFSIEYVPQICSGAHLTPEEQAALAAAEAAAAAAAAGVPAA